VWTLSDELHPLGEVKEYLSVLTGLQNHCQHQIAHHEGMTVFNGYSFDDYEAQCDFDMNGVIDFTDPNVDPMSENACVGLYSKAGGPTIDQVVADAIGTTTPTKSIQVGVSRRLSVMDFGTTLAAVSHRGPNEPLYPEFNPQTVWQLLFGGFMPKVDDRSIRTSVLDAVAADAKRLRPRLGAVDKTRLDAHLEGIHELEAKLAAAAPACALPPKPIETNPMGNGDEPLTSVNEAMSDLLVYALACDITRVASMLFIGGASITTFSDLNQVFPHHFNTHDKTKQDLVHEGVLYIMRHLAYLLEKMKDTVDPTGQNLLDTGIVYVASDCAEGLTHSIARQPIVLAGHGRNKLVFPGIHYQAAPAPGGAGNTSDVLLTVLQAFDPTAESVGGDVCVSTTPLTDIRGPG
jgi:hypothetical protein